ncbi:MAG: hypothetical protein ACM3VT_07660 [Solirubrobacterales bacterium]
MLQEPFRHELSRHKQAQDAAWKIESLGGRVQWNPRIEVLETLYYDKALSRITDVRFRNPAFGDESWLVLKELPQRFGLHVEGPQFTDASLESLKQVGMLKYLVLKNTAVTDRGIAELQDALSHVTVMRGYPGEPGYHCTAARIPETLLPRR